VNDAPDRQPDHVVTDHVQPEQGAIYRLSGDRNPIHIDPDFAQAAGFAAPFLHGLCTYGIVVRAILATVCGGDPKRFVSFSARFADQVFYGNDVVTKLWVTGEGEAIMRAESQKGNTVLSQAKATFK
jgi:acyl dehydratase